MCELKYIIIGTLPEKERNYLEENLKRESEEFWSWQQWNMTVCRPEESILVSGKAEELLEAKELGMAALGYLAPGQNKDGMPAEGRERTQGLEEQISTDTPPADMYAEGFEEIGFQFLRRVYERHHHIPWTILVTERCVVREFSMEYLDELFSLYEGEGMTDYIEPLFPYEQEREYQQAYIDNMYGFYGYGMWIVCEKETGKLIGRAGVERREELGGELELGYAIGVPWQRKGYAAEVCLAILSYIKEELEYSRVCCLIEEGNVVSESLAVKLGFSYRETLELNQKNMKKYVIDV